MERLYTSDEVDALLRQVGTAGDPLAISRLTVAVRELVCQRDQLIEQRNRLLEERNRMASRLTRGTSLATANVPRLS